MTPRKFDLETGLCILYDEFGGTISRNRLEKVWQVTDFTSNTRQIRPKPNESLEELVKETLRICRSNVEIDLQYGAEEMLKYSQKLERIKSLGNIGKDDN